MTDRAERTDFIIRAARILTPAVMDGAASPTFLAVRDGRIAAIGDATHAGAWEATTDRVIDVGDAVVSPGLIDSHLHPLLGADLARGRDLAGVRTLAAFRAAIAEEVARRPDPAEWILAWGLDPAVFEGAPFTNAVLDGVADGRLVFIVMFDCHSALASSEALALAGVRGDESFVDAAAVAVDASGRPTGLLSELSAQDLVRRVLPEQTLDERVDALRRLLQSMAETGLVGGHVLDYAVPDMFDVLEGVERDGDLPIRLRISPWALAGVTDAQRQHLLHLQGRRGRRWFVSGVKLMIDGTIDNGTAWLFAPDSHGESTAPLWHSVDAFVDTLRYFHAHGVPTTTHAIGDRAISVVAQTIGGLEPNGTMHRIEHIETLPDEVLGDIVRSGASASMQPTHCTLYTRADKTDNWSMRLGDERADNAWRTRSLRDAGTIVALGSDWPVAPFDPRPILASAQTRRRPGFPEEEPVVIAEALTARDALEGYTQEAWRSLGDAGGRLEVGARADITVLGHDPLGAAPHEVETSPVLLTVVDGEIVVDRIFDVAG